MSIAANPDASVAAPALEDRRVLELEQLVDSGDFDVLSLDVFDTLVSRMVPEPRDVFFLVAGRLRALDAVFESATPESFVRERIESERRARVKQPSREVTLDEIYAEFPAGYLRGMAPADVARLELMTEREVVRPYDAMVALVARARARGMTTALVSDTYFDADQLLQLTGVAVDHVLPSCAFRRPKRLGLHEELLARTRVAAARVLHVGDNFDADIEGPGLGFARYWFRRFPDEYRGLLEMELPEPLSRRAPYVSRPDQGLATLRGRAMFASATAHERWGAGVYGPVIAGFGDWVAARCRALGIGSALCLMREGGMLRAVLALADPGLAAREVFVSRFVTLHAAIFAGSEDEVLRFANRPSPPRAGTLLAQLGLDAADVRGVDAERRLAPAEVRGLARAIAGDRRLRARVVAAAAESRARLLRHLEAGGALSGTVAVVDLGYNATIQECLARVLRRERPGVATHGLYLVTGGGVSRAQAAGCAVEGWIAENGQPVAMAHTFMRSPEVAEQSLMADCGSTIGYEQDGTPVLDTPRVPDAQRAEIAQVQRGILRFAALWAQARAAHGPPDPAIARRAAQATAIRMVSRPLDAELLLFGHWQHDENFGSEESRTLTTVTELHEWEAEHQSAHQLASLEHARVYWPFGYAATRGPVMRDAVAAIYARTAEPGLLCSTAPAFSVGFFWDTGPGFDPRHTQVREVTAGAGGRAWERFSLRLHEGALACAALAIGVRGEVVHLRGVRVHLVHADGTRETRTLDHAELEKVGYRPLHGTLYLVDEEPALVVVPVGTRGFTGAVHVDVFFAVLAAA